MNLGINKKNSSTTGRPGVPNTVIDKSSEMDYSLWLIFGIKYHRRWHVVQMLIATLTHNKLFMFVEYNTTLKFLISLFKNSKSSLSHFHPFLTNFFFFSFFVFYNQDPSHSFIFCNRIKKYFVTLTQKRSRHSSPEVKPEVKVIEIEGSNSRITMIPHLKPFTQYCAVVELTNDADLRSPSSEQECLVTRQTSTYLYLYGYGRFVDGLSRYVQRYT